MSERFNGSWYIDSQGYDAIDKYAGSKLSYTLDFRDEVSPRLDDGEDLVSITYTVPTGITKESQTLTVDDASLVLSGGTAGKVYTFRYSATTTNLIECGVFKVYVK